MGNGPSFRREQGSVEGPTPSRMRNRHRQHAPRRPPEAGSGCVCRMDGHERRPARVLAPPIHSRVHDGTTDLHFDRRSRHVPDVGRHLLRALRARAGGRLRAGVRADKRGSRWARARDPRHDREPSWDDDPDAARLCRAGALSKGRVCLTVPIQRRRSIVRHADLRVPG
jgi:hypothetical protein